jgi:hypothetical protein
MFVSDKLDVPLMLGAIVGTIAVWLVARWFLRRSQASIVERKLEADADKEAKARATQKRVGDLFYQVLQRVKKNNLWPVRIVRDVSSSEGIYNILIYKRVDGKLYGAAMIEVRLDRILQDDVAPLMVTRYPSEFFASYGADARGFDNAFEDVARHIQQEVFPA